jgi:hypothetical protein
MSFGRGDPPEQGFYELVDVLTGLPSDRGDAFKAASTVMVSVGIFRGVHPLSSHEFPAFFP